MKIIDRVSKGLGLSDNEEQETDMITQDETNTPQAEPKETPIQPPPANTAEHKVIDFNSATRDNFMTNNNTTAKPMVKSKITTVRPKNFDDDAKVVADCLREDIPVIINLEDTNPEHARRIIDFALGRRRSTSQRICFRLHAQNRRRHLQQGRTSAGKRFLMVDATDLR